MSDADPQATCEICGGANPSWHVDSDRWNTALYRGAIACPSCFIEAHEAATGMRSTWALVPSTPFRWIDDDGRPTPFGEVLR
ncbi:hypothetical protein [Demequina sp. SO4-18]|uniref:hypothetical protein n=1 Tax=Demequina sp. SO4-18 TaxID=3401026 RepID=UPI003B5C7606